MTENFDTLSTLQKKLRKAFLDDHFTDIMGEHYIKVTNASGFEKHLYRVDTLALKGGGAFTIIGRSHLYEIETPTGDFTVKMVELV